MENLPLSAKFNYVILPRDKEIMQAIRSAACEYADVPEEALAQQSIKNRNTTMAYLRQMCFYLISTNTGCKDYMIGDYFGLKRVAVNYGIEQIDTHRRVYRQTLDSLNNIIELANKFEKKHEWLIPRLNTTN